LEILTQNSNANNFTFQDTRINVFIDGDEIWFIAKEVSDILGYSETSKMLRRIDNEDKQTVARNRRSFIPLEFFGNQGSLTLINESGLYNSVFGSKLALAKKFKLWVTREVLPSIRKTGSYSISQDSTIPKSEIQELTEYSKQVFELLNLVQAQDSISLHRFSKIFEKQDKKSPLELFDINLENQFFIPTELGKMVGKTPIEINKILEFQGLQFSDNGVWKLTEKGQKVGIEIFGRFFQLKWKIAVLDNI